MKNPYDRKTEEYAKRMRERCVGVVPTIDDAVFARVIGTLMLDARLFNAATRLLAEFQDRLQTKAEDLWGLD